MMTWHDPLVIAALIWGALVFGSLVLIQLGPWLDAILGPRLSDFVRVFLFGYMAIGAMIAAQHFVFGL